MTYTVSFTEKNSSIKIPITVVDNTFNTQTSVTLIGEKLQHYTKQIGENFLHLLENFANSTPPKSAIQGQLWYDNTNSLLKVYDGSNWRETSGVLKSATAPTNKLLGDIWVNTAANQVFIWAGASWELVGPSSGSTVTKGPKIESLIDNTSNHYPHDVLSIYLDGTRLAIFSKDTFTPSNTIPGFSTIKSGITLTTLNSPNYWGIAETATKLLINNVAVPASDFIRRNSQIYTTEPIIVESESGITIGSASNLIINNTQSVVNVFSTIPGQGIDFNVTTQLGNILKILHLDSTGKLGIGTNTPVATLDVSGSVKISDSITIANTSSTSIVSAGGMSISGQCKVNGTGIFTNGIEIDKLDTNITPPVPSEGTVLLPGSTGKYDIGSNTKRFRNVYATTFHGSFTGNITGNITGDVTGSASKLSTARSFNTNGRDAAELPSQVSSTSIDFDGRENVALALKLEPFAITAQNSITNTQQEDLFLMYRDGTGLGKIKQSVLLSSIAHVPIGGIVIYSAPITSETPLPSKFLRCNGAEISKKIYSTLFSVIGYTYTPQNQLTGTNTFALPNISNLSDNVNLVYLIYTGVA